MAQAQRGRHRTFRIAVEVPRLLAVERRIGGMQTVDRAERAQLVPADLQLLVTVAEHVAADVVAPPAVADVGSAGGEFRLELERFPRHDGVAGEADRVAVRARAGVTREGERRGLRSCSRCRGGGVEVMHVVQPHSGSRPCCRVRPPCCQSIHQKSTPSSSMGWCMSK